MQNQIESFILDEQLLFPGDHVLVAVSGGVDSMVLLDVLCQFQEKFQLELRVAHLDHQLRTDSEADAQLVVEQAKQRGLAYTVKQTDVAALAEKIKQSVETAGRDARYQFLTSVANEQGCQSIALGHHQNDQAETFLLNLIRGANVQGWGGMKPKSDACIRPLLHCSKAQIRQYAQEHDIEFREDDTNTDQQFRRNWIRHEVIPLLEQKNENWIDAITRNQAIFREISDYLRKQADQAYEEVVVEFSESDVTLNRKNFNQLDPALQSEIIRLVVQNLYGSLVRLESDHILKVRKHSQQLASGQVVELPLGLKVFIQAESLLFSMNPEQPSEIESMELVVPGKTAWDGWNFTAALKDVRNGQDIGSLSVCMDWSKIEPPLVVRSRQPGDRIDPIGLGGHKKIQDIFVDAKVARTARDRVPLIADQQGIVWVVGHCQSERTRVTSASRRLLFLRGEQHELGK